MTDSATNKAAPSAADLEGVAALSAELMAQKLLTLTEAREKFRAFSARVLRRMEKDNLSFGRASRLILGDAGNPLEHLNQDEAAVRAHLTTIDNDLGAQIDILDRCFGLWFAIGQVVTPYHAWRVAIILRSASRRDLEVQWLDAWLRHFGPKEFWQGQRFKALSDRRRFMRAL